MNYMEQTFLYPTDFDTLLYASQLLQAEAMRYGVEHFSRNRGQMHGNDHLAAQRLLAGGELGRPSTMKAGGRRCSIMRSVSSRR